AHRGRRIDGLLVQVQVNTARFQVLDYVKQVYERAAEAIYRPRHGNIKLPPAGVLEQAIKTRPSISPLGAGYTGIVINVAVLPATPLGDLPKLTDLVLYGLPVRADSHIQRRALCHDLVPSALVLRGPKHVTKPYD